MFEATFGRITMKSIVLKGFLFIVLAWFLLFMIMSVLPNNQPNNVGEVMAVADATEILQRMDAALKEIEKLKRNNLDMKRLLESNSNEYKRVDLASSGKWEGHSGGGTPTGEYESTRRFLELDLKELWYTVNSKSDRFSENDFKQIQEIYRILRSNLMRLRNADGYEEFRRNETQALSRIVQKRIRALQNPTNCETAKKLVCSLNKGCGFGCQVHHLCYCLITAYATGRTLILESRGWRYNRAGWEKVFLPLSDTCTSNTGSSRGEWNGGNSAVQVLTLPIVDFLKPRPDFLPVSIPSDISTRLEKAHGEPHIWWVGQFVKYVLRPQPHIQAMIDEAIQSTGIKPPTVGLHIRRTDKIGTEASFHGLDEYMRHAIEYFEIKEKLGIENERRVFVASDDPSVINEAKKSYPSPTWDILGDTVVARSAALSQRYAGLNGIIRDIFLLAECDFLVCTFSSQVCRLAYELLQTKHTDASQRFVSLDDVYYYGGGIGIQQEAYMAHKPNSPNELELEVGDIIGVAGNHWNGMSKGTNRRTNKLGLYPSYKARNKYSKVNYPNNKWWPSSAEV